MSDFADGIINELRAKLLPEAQAIADDVADDIRRAVSVPVGFDERLPFVRTGGRRVIRSKPGEPPRRETGEYQSSIDSVVSIDGDHIRAAAFTDSLLGDWLENGTSRGLEPRPHFQPAFERWQGPATERLAAAANGE